MRQRTVRRRAVLQHLRDVALELLPELRSGAGGDVGVLLGVRLRAARGHASGRSAEAREERRIVSVLFADLAGSTALGGRLDPEDVRELQGELFEFLNAEVERHGGMTENSSATR